MTVIVKSMTPAQSNVEYGLLIVTIVILVLLLGATFGSLINGWILDLAHKVTATITLSIVPVWADGLR